jgi:hypothetical protein
MSPEDIVSGEFGGGVVAKGIIRIIGVKEA